MNRTSIPMAARVRAQSLTRRAAMRTVAGGGLTTAFAGVGGFDQVRAAAQQDAATPVATPGPPVTLSDATLRDFAADVEAALQTFRVPGAAVTLVQGNEIAYNNYLKGVSYGWEAGGTKFVKTRGLIVRSNYVHHNWGTGLWTDIDNINTLVEGNRVIGNANQGIFHEISYAAVIRNNTVQGNGFDRCCWLMGAAILVAASPDRGGRCE